MSTPDQELVLTHFIVSDDVERSRRFYTDGHLIEVGQRRTQRGTGRPLTGYRVRPPRSHDE
jgi:hypothetical protein